MTAFIFDLDGTLVDALPDIHANTNMALQELGYNFQLSLAETQPHVGGGAQKLASSVLNKPMDHADTMALYHSFTAIYQKYPADFGKPFAGVIETLTSLQEQGIPMSVVTAKPALARIQVLKHMGLQRFLHCALSPEDGFKKKPAPDMLWECCRQMKVEPKDTWMVGDTRFDIEAGLNAKCRGVAFVPHGYAPLANDLADKVLRLRDIPHLLELV
ncbi:MAG: HAD hydrolase-like protein [Mariprofundales bacterium]